MASVPLAPWFYQEQVALTAAAGIWFPIADCHRLVESIQEVHRELRNPDVLWQIELDSNVAIAQER